MDATPPPPPPPPLEPYDYTPCEYDLPPEFRSASYSGREPEDFESARTLLHLAAEDDTGVLGSPLFDTTQDPASVLGSPVIQSSPIAEIRSGTVTPTPSFLDLRAGRDRSSSLKKTNVKRARAMSQTTLDAFVNFRYRLQLAAERRNRVMRELLAAAEQDLIVDLTEEPKT
jgi:hypothetical protein